MTHTNVTKHGKYLNYDILNRDKEFLFENIHLYD